MENFPANQEIWMSVDGYLNYEISSFGRVRNATTGKMRSIQTKCDGYQYVALSKDNHLTKHYIHRLVASAFIPNHNNSPVVDHIDHNKSNNMAKNLRWATFQENSYNRQKSKNKSCGSKGVYKVKSGRYSASIAVNEDSKRKTIHLGTFDTEEEAKEAYKTEAIKRFGEFACYS